LSHLAVRETTARCDSIVKFFGSRTYTSLVAKLSLREERDGV
jgi:hypothetical protein